MSWLMPAVQLLTMAGCLWHLMLLLLLLSAIAELIVLL
jgi:hypothetical protein